MAEGQGEAAIVDQLQFLATVIERNTQGKGFMLMVFDMEGRGEGEPRLNYVSNAKREDVINVLKEWMIKCGAAEDWMKRIG